MKFRDKVQDCIEDRIIQHVLKNNVSLNDMFCNYHTRLYNLKQITPEPYKKLAQLMAKAYKGTMNDYR